MNKTKIGIFINSKLQLKENSDLIRWLINKENLAIEILVINNNSNKLINFFLNCILIFENFFSKSEELELPKYPNNKIILNDKNFFKKDDIENITNLNLDIIVNLTPENFKGEAFKLSKFGIISSNIFRKFQNQNNPPGFWEVYNNQPETNFSLTIQKEESTQNIIYEGNFSTQLIFSLNRKFSDNKKSYYLKKIIDFIIINKSFPQSLEKREDIKNILKTPTFIQILFYMFFAYSRILKKVIFKYVFLKKSNWHVAFNNKNWKNNSLKNLNVIKNPKNHYLADPFLYKYNNKYYCFLEEYSYLKKKGHVAVYEINNNAYQRLGVCLQESFHLSFPYIFNFDGKIFMCPESSRNKEIRIYESIEFPLKWNLKKIIMKNVSASDSMIFKYKNKWWLLTNLDNSDLNDHSSELNIFYSKNGPITDNWIKHDTNPIFIDSLKARNGGLIFENDKIHRVAQSVGFNIYGKSFSLNQINQLSESQYSENKLYDVKPNFLKNIKGTHHYNGIDNLTVIDFCKDNYFNF